MPKHYVIPMNVEHDQAECVGHPGDWKCHCECDGCKSHPHPWDVVYMSDYQNKHRPLIIVHPSNYPTTI